MNTSVNLSVFVCRRSHEDFSSIIERMLYPSKHVYHTCEALPFNLQTGHS